MNQNINFKPTNEEEIFILSDFLHSQFLYSELRNKIARLLHMQSPTNEDATFLDSIVITMGRNDSIILKHALSILEQDKQTLLQQMNNLQYAKNRVEGIRLYEEHKWIHYTCEAPASEADSLIPFIGTEREMEQMKEEFPQLINWEK